MKRFIGARLARARYALLLDDLERAAHPGVDAAEVRVPPDLQVGGRGRGGGRAAAVDEVEAERAGVPPSVGERVVRHVRAVARPAARRDAVPDGELLVGVHEGQRAALLDTRRRAHLAGEAVIPRRVREALDRHEVRLHPLAAVRLPAVAPTAPALPARVVLVVPVPPAVERAAQVIHLLPPLRPDRVRGTALARLLLLVDEEPDV